MFFRFWSRCPHPLHLTRIALSAVASQEVSSYLQQALCLSLRQPIFSRKDCDMNDDIVTLHFHSPSEAKMQRSLKQNINDPDRMGLSQFPAGLVCLGHTKTTCLHLEERSGPVQSPGMPEWRINRGFCCARLACAAPAAASPVDRSGADTRHRPDPAYVTLCTPIQAPLRLKSTP